MVNDLGNEPRTEGRRRFAAWWARYRILVGLLALSLVVSVLIRHVVYPAYSWNRDEVTYQWQVSVLRSGHLFGADGGFKHLFWPWLSGHNDHGFFSQYTLGWPLVLLAFDLVFGSSAGAILVGVAALVLGAYALTLELTRDRRLALVTTALLVASPMFVVQSGVYLGYLFSTGIGLLFGAALLAGLRRDDWRLVAVGGALLGYLFLTRPYDAVLWGGAIGAYAVIASWRKWARLARGAIVAGLAFVPFLLLVLLYNRRITGSFTQFPFTAKDPLDTFGLGVRRLMPGTRTYVFTRREAMRGVFRNFFYFPNFLVGAWLGVAVAFVGLWLRRRERSTLALLALMAVFPLGYAIFWGIRLSSFYAFLSAPLYLIPLYVPVCIFIGTVILWLWSTRRAVFTVVLCVVLAVVTVPFLLSRLNSNQEISRAQEPWRTSDDSLPDSSLVFIATNTFLMHLNPFSANAPQLDNAGPLYATDHPLGMLALIAAYPDRTPVLQLSSKPFLGDAFHNPHPDPPKIHIIPMKVLSGSQFAITARGEGEDERSDRGVVARRRCDRHARAHDDTDRRRDLRDGVARGHTGSGLDRAGDPAAGPPRPHQDPQSGDDRRRAPPAGPAPDPAVFVPAGARWLRAAHADPPPPDPPLPRPSPLARGAPLPRLRRRRRAGRLSGRRAGND